MIRVAIAHQERQRPWKAAVELTGMYLQRFLMGNRNPDHSV